MNLAEFLGVGMWLGNKRPCAGGSGSTLWPADKGIGHSNPGGEGRLPGAKTIAPMGSGSWRIYNLSLRSEK